MKIEVIRVLDLHQPLYSVFQGLEGRTSNPIALLFDSLNHPQADLGLELPSLLNWKLSSKQAIDHVVIGRGPPGGAWQSMDGSVLTISLGCWMELPEMNFREWEAQQEARCVRESRASVSSVAQYYCDYVRAHNLQKYFRGDSFITSVSRVPPPKRLPIEVCDRSAECGGERIRRHTISEIPVNSNDRGLRRM